MRFCAHGFRAAQRFMWFGAHRLQAFYWSFGHTRTHTHTCTHARARTHARAHARTRTRTHTHTHHTERFPRGFGAEILPYSGLLITTLGYEPGVTNMATRQQAKILNFRHPPYPPNSKLSLTVQDTLVHDKCFSAQVMFNIVLGEGGR